jgi:hypothetical protein
MTTDDQVAGFCPMGCGKTLFLAAGGYVTCSYSRCPDPGKVSDLLLDSETQHIVELAADGFSIRHPLRERPDDLTKCALHVHVAGLDGPPRKPGRYRVYGTSSFVWQELLL